MYDDEYGTYENEPYHDDLQEFSDREAWEDMHGDLDDSGMDDLDEFVDEFEDEPYAEDCHIDLEYESRYEME